MIWVKDHKFLPVWRGVWIMPRFQGLPVNQIGTSINLSWEHLAQKELWCTSDVVHGVGRVLAEVHSTAVISYPSNGNIKLEQRQPGITLDGWVSPLLHIGGLGKDKETKVRTDLANDREENWASEVAFSPFSTPSRSYLTLRCLCLYFSETTKELLPRILPNDTHIGAFEITKVLGKDEPLSYNVIPYDS